MKEAFITREFQPPSLLLIDFSNRIINDFQNQGYNLTLRQLYYQLVAGAIIENSMKSYNKIKSLISNARLAGLIDWDAIEDRTRNLETIACWDSPVDALESLREQYKEDLWINQDFAVEVWVEKEALIGVIEVACSKYRIPHLACRGYMSQSEQYAAAQRFRQAADNGKQGVVIHLGDHDPSGMDMTRDNSDRLTMLSRSCGVLVRRIALSMDQIEELEPPPNPAKESDSRSDKYVAEYGHSSWELDALPPQYIDRIINAEVEKYLDADQWQQDYEKEGGSLQQIENATAFIEDRY